MKMVLNLTNPAFRAALPMVVKRNFGSSYVFMAKAGDPIQQLFVDKVREFSNKMNDKNFSKDYPGLRKALDEELQRVTRQYGAEKPEELAKFPDFKAEKPAIDTVQGFEIR